MAVAATSQMDWGGLVSASKTSDKFTGWKSDATTGQLSKVSAMDSENTADELQGRFLKLLVAQLKNQDPNNPLDNAQVTSQMAQLSTVTGIQGLNDTFKSMAAMMNASQTMQASSLVGKEVMVSGSNVSLFNGQPARLGFNLDGIADSVRVDIKSKSGEVLDTIEMGRQAAGLKTMEWDGRGGDGQMLADGDYTFALTATAAGKAVMATPFALAPVLSVAQDANGALLQTRSMGDVRFTDVKRVF
jgi:flagellar basal-body rod modification protein FlgD